MDSNKVWASALKNIENVVGQTAIETWFAPIQAKLLENKFILEVPDEFFKDWVIQHYLKLIKSALEEVVPDFPHDIQVRVNALIYKSREQSRLADFTQRVQPRQITTLNLNSRFTFDQFVIGSSNRFAHAASLAVAESPAKAYNPFFIYGGVGLGKTHLMQAIAHFILKKRNDAKITYIPSEKFTNELIGAIQHRSTSQFRTKYRNVDVLLIDDIQFIAGKESTQEEFFHTFNELYDHHKQIVLSSDRPPREIANLEERLISRFQWGLITDIQPPNFETRIAILKKKIEHEPVQVPEDVVYFIADLIKTNIRELEGALIRVIAYSLLEEKTISLNLAQDVLRDMLTESAKIITIERIQKEVAGMFNVTVNEVRSKRRTKNIILPRQIAMYLARELTTQSLPEIGEAFGGKNHTTVLYACKKIKKEINNNKQVSNFVSSILKNIKQ
ncbi:MAG: chromosomal replication initiator protein DnaA [Candidatus Omnitrophica bacterium]|nr:chromosomal replication initiator protein DnaA [Candidatus Omnitrophota bacterium]